MKTLLKTILRDMYLMYSSPIEYLFLHEYSKHEKVTVSRFDNKVYSLGVKIKSEIEDLFPNLKVHFLGSAELKIAGQNDLDIFIESNVSEFNNQKDILEQHFGPVTKIMGDFMEWHVTRNNCDVQIILADTNSKLLKHHIYIHKVLSIKDNKAAYEKMKIELNGASLYDYEKARQVFFNKLTKRHLGIKTLKV